MSAKTEIIAMVVRIVANKTSLINKPDAFESFLTTIFGEDTYDVRIAKNIEAEASRLIETAKQIKTDRQFKKIVEHV